MAIAGEWLKYAGKLRALSGTEQWSSVPPPYPGCRRSDARHSSACRCPGSSRIKRRSFNAPCEMFINSVAVGALP